MALLSCHQPGARLHKALEGGSGEGKREGCRELPVPYLQEARSSSWAQQDLGTRTFLARETGKLSSLPWGLATPPSPQEAETGLRALREEGAGVFLGALSCSRGGPNSGVLPLPPPGSCSATARKMLTQQDEDHPPSPSGIGPHLLRWC